MTTDVWMQHPSLRFYQHRMFKSLWRWTGGAAPSQDVPVATTVALFRAAGVSTALTSAWCGPEGWLITNDEAASFAEQSAGLIRPVASVDLNEPMQAVRELRRAVTDLGCIALRIVPWLWGFPPDDRRCYPLYAACCDMEIPFCTQVGHTGPLRGSEPGRPIPYLDHVALDFPELKIVAGHIGYPWVEEMISLTLKYPNVYIDTSAYVPKRYPASFVSFMKGAGRSKVMFGTNYPMLQPAQCLNGVQALGLEPENAELFLDGTARAVFRL